VSTSFDARGSGSGSIEGGGGRAGRGGRTAQAAFDETRGRVSGPGGSIQGGNDTVNNVDPYTQVPNYDALTLVVNAVQKCERDYHNEFVRKVEKRYMSYRGLMQDSDLMQADSDPTEQWRSQITTPYVLNTCEGMLATMLEPRPRFDVQPRPHPDEPIDAILSRISSIDAIEDTLTYAFDRDHFAVKQRPFMQQDMIAGLSVLKTYWRSETRKVTKLGAKTMTIADAFGQPYDRLTVYQEEEPADTLVTDDACCEVVDVRDFFWPGVASSPEKAEFLIHRTWETWDSLKRKENDGYFDYENVDLLKHGMGTSSVPQTAQVTAREMRLRHVDRTWQLVEILEYWTPERVVTVGNRFVVLQDRPNPFWGGRMPFIVCSGMPDAFQIPGLSIVEALAQLQEMLWTLQNQRLDVVRMLANVITLVRSDVDDPEAFVWEPGATWLVEDPGQVSPLQPDSAAAEITLQAEGLLKGDLQNIMGGLPMNAQTAGSDLGDATATTASIITTIAQRLIQARKQHYLWAYAKVAKHFLLLYQQFLREERVVRILGQQGALAYRTVTPLEVQGDYDVTIDVTADSLMRQERRAEAQSLLQMASQFQPIFAQTGTPLNLKAFMEKTLDAYNVTDKDRYFLPKPSPQGAPAGPPGPPGGPPGMPPGPPGAPAGPPPVPGGPGAPVGVTNPQLAAGPTSPSNVQTISPEAAMQRMLAMQGGGNNAPRPGG
jgi:hypothetical protein